MDPIHRRQPAELHLLRPRAEGGFARERQWATDGPRGLVRDAEGALWTTAGKGASLRRLPADGPAAEFAADGRTHIADFLLTPKGPWVRTAFEVVALDGDLAEKGRLEFGGFGFQRRVEPDGDGVAVLDEERVVRLAPDASVKEEQALGFRAGHFLPAGEGRFLASDGYPGHLALAEPGRVTRLSDSAFEKSASSHEGALAWVDGQEPRGTPRTLAVLDAAGTLEVPGEAGARSAIALPGRKTLLYREFVLQPSFSIFDRDGQEVVRHDLGDAAMVKDFLMTPDRSRAWAVAQRRETGGDRMVRALLEFDLAGAGPMRVLHESPDDFMPAPLTDGGVLIFAKDGVKRLGDPARSWPTPAEMLREYVPEVAASQACLGALAFADAGTDLGSVLAEAGRRYRYPGEAWLPVDGARQVSTATGVLRAFDTLPEEAAAPLLGLDTAAEALRMGLMPGLAEAMVLVLASRIPLPDGAHLELQTGEILLHRLDDKFEHKPGLRLKGDEFTSALPFTADGTPYLAAGTRGGALFLWDVSRAEGGVEEFHVGAGVSSLRLTAEGVVFSTRDGALGALRLPGRAVEVGAEPDRKQIVPGQQTVRVGDVELPIS